MFLYLRGQRLLNLSQTICNKLPCFKINIRDKHLKACHSNVMLVIYQYCAQIVCITAVHVVPSWSLNTSIFSVLIDILCRINWKVLQDASLASPQTTRQNITFHDWVYVCNARYTLEFCMYNVITETLHTFVIECWKIFVFQNM